MRRISAIFATALAAAHPAIAEDSNGQFAIKGAGLQTCESLVKSWDGQSSDLGLYAGWVDGYLTGMNQHSKTTFDIAPWQSTTTLLSLLRQMCTQRDANDRVIDLLNDLMSDFAPARLKEQSSASAIRRGDSALVLYDETVSALQRRLTQEGFDPGEPNGVYTDQTATALEAFQTSRGLTVTGLPDQKTLFALFVQTTVKN